MSKTKMMAGRYPCGCVYSEDSKDNIIHYVMPGCRFRHYSDCRGYTHKPVDLCPRWVKEAIGHAFGYSDTGVFVGADAGH